MKLHAPRMEAVCLALAVLFVSCPSPLGNATMGTIRLSFTGASRGVIEPRELVDPTLAIKTLLVDISGPGMERLTSQPVAYDTRGTALTMSVPAGLDRAVTISARNEAGTALYSQTQTVAIVAGKELRLSFNLNGVLYSVSFDANGGSGTMAPQSIAYGSKAALTPNGFTRAGYSFVGWTTTATSNANYADKADYIMNTTNTTLYAVWMANTSTIAFNANGGSGTMTEQTLATDAIAPLTENSFTRVGYTFKGWSLTAAGAVAFANNALYTMGTSSVILYAVWEPILYTITYNLNGGSSTNLGSFTVESAAITLTPPTRTGFSFGGWFDDEELTVGSNTTIPTGSSENKVFWAKWTIITYNITYNLDGGSGTNIGTFTIESGTLTLNDPIKADFIFSGWFDNPGFTGEVIMSLPSGSTS